MSAESITQMDLTAVRALSDIHAELKAKEIRLLIARPKLHMRKYGEVSDLGERLGQENMFPSIRAPVDAISPQDTHDGSDAGPAGSAHQSHQSYRNYFERQQQKNREGQKSEEAPHKLERYGARHEEQGQSET